MIDFGNLRFPTVDRTFLKGIFWILVFLFLATIFASARGIYDKFLKRPEVRISSVQIGPEWVDDGTLWSQTATVVVNKGNTDAHDVFIGIFYQMAR